MSEYEIYIGLAVALLALGLVVLKWYAKAKKDGKISLEEVIDLLEDSQDEAEDVIDAAEKVAKDIKKRRTCSVCGETGHDKRKCPENV